MERLRTHRGSAEMFNGWKITNILDVGLCELDTADGPYNKTGDLG